MSEMHTQPCPLCGEPALYCLADFHKRKQFSCPQCTDYQITDTAERKLKAVPAEWRAAIAKKAKAQAPDSVLDIFVPSGARVENEGFESLTCESILRVKLPPCH